MRQYSVLLLPDPLVGGYTVEVPALPGVVSEGNTREEAPFNAREAINLYIEDLVADGEAIPEEIMRPELAIVDVMEPSTIDEAAILTVSHSLKSKRAS